jgi:hypothetical protein
MMHEVGHLFGCPHQASGVMLRDYPRLHRSITAIEPHKAKKEVGEGLCHWHILDLLRFAGHPSFKLPEDDAIRGEMTAMPCPAGLYIEAQDGLRVIEIYGSGEFPVGHMMFEHSRDNKQAGTQQMVLTEAALRQHVNLNDGKVKVQTISRTNQTVTIDDLAAALRTDDVAGVGQVFRSNSFGFYPGHDEQVMLTFSPTKVIVWAGACLDGIEFQSANPDSSQLLGKRGGAPHPFELQRDEHIIGFIVRSGAWVDGLALLTNQRELPMCGNAQGGSPHTLRAPPGMRCCGVFGKVEGWMTQFGMCYTAT